MNKLAEKLANEFNGVAEVIIKEELKDEKALQLMVTTGIPLIAINLLVTVETTGISELFDHF